MVKKKANRFRVAGNLAQIRTRNLPNSGPNHYHLKQFPRLQIDFYAYLVSHINITCWMENSLNSLKKERTVWLKYIQQITEHCSSSNCLGDIDTYPKVWPVYFKAYLWRWRSLPLHYVPYSYKDRDRTLVKFCILHSFAGSFLQGYSHDDVTLRRK